MPFPLKPEYVKIQTKKPSRLLIKNNFTFNPRVIKSKFRLSLAKRRPFPLVESANGFRYPNTVYERMPTPKW